MKPISQNATKQMMTMNTMITVLIVVQAFEVLSQDLVLQQKFSRKSKIKFNNPLQMQMYLGLITLKQILLFEKTKLLNQTIHLHTHKYLTKPNQEFTHLHIAQIVSIKIAETKIATKRCIKHNLQS